MHLGKNSNTCLCDVEGVEGELVLVLGVHRLDAERPLGVGAGGDGLVEVLLRVDVARAANCHRLVVQQALDACTNDSVTTKNRSLNSLFLCLVTRHRLSRLPEQMGIWKTPKKQVVPYDQM